MLLWAVQYEDHQLPRRTENNIVARRSVAIQRPRNKQTRQRHAVRAEHILSWRLIWEGCQPGTSVVVSRLVQLYKHALVSTNFSSVPPDPHFIFYCEISASNSAEKSAGRLSTKLWRVFLRSSHRTPSVSQSYLSFSAKKHRDKSDWGSLSLRHHARLSLIQRIPRGLSWVQSSRTVKLAMYAIRHFFLSFNNVFLSADGPRVSGMQRWELVFVCILDWKRMFHSWYSD
jgi:hypothetical protein